MTACGRSAPLSDSLPYHGRLAIRDRRPPGVRRPSPVVSHPSITTPAAKMQVFAAVLDDRPNTINTIYNSISLTPVYTRPSMSWDGNVTLAVVPSCMVAYSLGLGF